MSDELRLASEMQSVSVCVVEQGVRHWFVDPGRGCGGKALRSWLALCQVVKPGTLLDSKALGGCPGGGQSPPIPGLTPAQGCVHLTPSW